MENIDPKRVLQIRFLGSQEWEYVKPGSFEIVDEDGFMYTSREGYSVIGQLDALIAMVLAPETSARS